MADLDTDLQGLEAIARRPVVPRNTMAQVGAILGGFGAGLGMGNPVLEQFERQRDRELKEQLELIRVRQGAQRMRQERETSLLNIARDLIGSGSAPARKMGALIFERHLASQNVPVAPGFVDSFETGALSLDQRKQAYIAILANADDEYLTNVLNVPKPMLGQLRKEAPTDPIHRLLYGKSLLQEQLEISRSDLEQRRFDVVNRRADQQDRRLELQEARDTERAQEARDRLAIAQEQLDIAQRRQDLSEAKFEYLQAKGPDEKRQKALDQADLLANQLESTAFALNKLGYLPPPEASILDPAYLAARTNRIVYPNVPAWQLWVKHLQPAMIGYARSVQNDIGPRAIMAFEGALSLMNNPPDLRSIRGVVQNMRKAIQLGRAGEDVAQFLLIRRPDGSVIRVKWTRGMSYNEGDVVVGVE